MGRLAPGEGASEGDRARLDWGLWTGNLDPGGVVSRAEERAASSLARSSGQEIIRLKEILGRHDQPVSDSTFKAGVAHRLGRRTPIQRLLVLLLGKIYVWGKEPWDTLH